MHMSKRRKLADGGHDEEDDDMNVQLITPNHIIFYCDVSSKSLAQYRKIILSLESKKKQPDEVFVHIHSQGGCAYAGLALYDITHNSKLNIITIIEGGCFSAASFLAIAGNTRMIMPHGFLMIHQISEEFAGTHEEHKTEIANTSKMQAYFIDIYTKHTKLSKSQITKELIHDGAIDAKLALKNGYVDKIFK